MPRMPKPWYRQDRDAWFVTISGTRHNLGPDKKKAFDRFYQLMQQPKTAQVTSDAFAAVADAFLEWVSGNRAADTYEWYRYRLERFCKRYPDLTTGAIRPYHVQQWVDGVGGLSQTSRRNYTRSVKRCMKWAKKQGYIATDPIADMEVPGAEARECCVSKAEFATLCSFIRDEPFLQLCRVTFETGCRPQEILRVEVDHFDRSRSRWILPTSKAKGKKKPRIVYLSPYALEVTEAQVQRAKAGRIFRNTAGKPWTTDAVNCGFDRLRSRMGKAVITEKQLKLDDLVLEYLRSSGRPVASMKKLTERERVKYRNKVSSSYAPRYSLYAFRHSWATNALEAGVDALTVATLLGHSDTSTLAKVYSHVSNNPEHMRQQALRALGA